MIKFRENHSLRLLFAVTVVVLSLSLLSANGQERVITFGLQFKPIVPSGMLRSDNVSVYQNDKSYGIESTFAYSGGMVIRKGITNRFSLETGINFTKRKYLLTFVDNDSIFNGNPLRGEFGFAIVAYEIPVLALLYVRMTDKWHMNMSTGISTDFFPSNVQTTDLLTDTSALRLASFTVRNSWIQSAGVINFGFEYRSEKSGIFYFGGSLHWPFTAIYKSKVEYKDGVLVVLDSTIMELQGNYLTVDLRYFFHEDPEKRTARNKNRM